MFWCWFHLYQRGLLESYQSFRDWDPVPNMDDSRNYVNSEIFGLGLHPYSMQLASRFSAADLEQHVQTAGLSGEIPGPLDSTNVMDVVETWYMYNRSDWTAWLDIRPDGDIMFPAAGVVRPHYDYAGADAVLRVSAAVDRIMPEGGRRGQRGATGTAAVNWTAAAKPFGYLDTDIGKARPDSASDFVLPAFRDVRLIPADTASNSDAFSSDIDWVVHVKTHLHTYMDIGSTVSGCPYCNALVTWERQSFRLMGIDWLAENSHKCRIPTGGGGRPGGGTKRGH